MPYITLLSKEYSRLSELCTRPISRPIVYPDTSRISTTVGFAGVGLRPAHIALQHKTNGENAAHSSSAPPLEDDVAVR